jgi:SAM-dependent MidA family methyltransferase
MNPLQSTTELLVPFLEKMNELSSQQKEIIEKMSKMTTQNTTTNNTFNINIFLSEKCKNAIPIEDFVDNIEITDKHISYLQDNGFVEGNIYVFNEALNKYDIYTRPIHCTDEKRGMVRVFTKELMWVKESIFDSEIIKKSVMRVNHKGLKKLMGMIEMNPNYKIPGTK